MTLLYQEAFGLKVKLKNYQYLLFSQMVLFQRMVLRPTFAKK